MQAQHDPTTRGIAVLMTRLVGLYFAREAGKPAA
jgi:hypothetical protein